MLKFLMIMALTLSFAGGANAKPLTGLNVISKAESQSTFEKKRKKKKKPSHHRRHFVAEETDGLQ